MHHHSFVLDLLKTKAVLKRCDFDPNVNKLILPFPTTYTDKWSGSLCEQDKQDNPDFLSTSFVQFFLEHPKTFPVLMADAIYWTGTV